MKKVITILAILIIAAGTVFAAEPHKLKISAISEAVVPSFQLSFKDKTTNTQATSFENTDGYTITEAVDSGIKFETGGTVVVTAKLANAAKQNQAYTLTFSDGVFSVKKNMQTAEYAPATIVAAASVSNATGISSITAAGAVVTVTFNGTTASARELAKATYTYTADTAVDPGTYNADIVMTVATN